MTTNFPVSCNAASHQVGTLAPNGVSASVFSLDRKLTADCNRGTFLKSDAKTAAANDKENSMTTTHICLLSEQPIPNLAPLLTAHIRADNALFVVSPQQLTALEHMKTVLGPRGIRVEALEIADAMDYPSVLEALESTLAQRKGNGEQLLINATGGTKPMSIAAHMAGFNADIPVFYVENDRVHWLDDQGEERETFDIEERLKLKEYLAAYGFNLEGRKITPVPVDQFKLFQEVLTIPSFFAQIKTLNYIAWQAAESGTLTTPLSVAQKNNQGLQALLDKMRDTGLIELGGHEVRFTSPDSRDLCNGLWLEEFCYREAEKLKGMLGGKLQDLGRSLAIRGRGKGREPVDNELDIALLHDNRFYLVECKTRHFNDKGDPDVEEALYKLATLRRNVGGLYGKGLLVSAYPVADKHKRRAAALDIAICDGAADVASFRSYLKTWLV
jgi:hypothetical protein